MRTFTKFTTLSNLGVGVSAASIEWCEGQTRRTSVDGKTIGLCLWYDAVPGVMYSLSASAPDLDGFDITAIALQVFSPMQGDAG